MAENVQEETGFVDYYYSTGLKDPVTPPSLDDPTAGIESTVLKPFEVKGIDTPLIDILTRPNTGSYAGKPVFETFKVDLDKVYDFEAELEKLTSDSGADEVGIFADPDKLGKVLGTGGMLLGSTGQNLGMTGVVAGLLAGKKGVPNPVTGDNTVTLIPFLDNLVMKERYDAISAIQDYLKTGDGTLGYDMFRLGGQTFIRRPGEFRFVGNVSALGVDHIGLHKIMAVANEEDPRDYDYKTGKSTRNNILTYGSGLAGGYTLDGMHVDNKGILASASIGASQEFAQMAYKYFNGKVIGADASRKIAQQWLASTAKLRKGGIFGGNYTAAQKAQLKANFQLFQQAAGVTTDLGAYGQGGPYDGGGYSTNLTSAGSSTTDMYDSADDDVNQSDFTGTDMYDSADDDVNQSDLIGTNFTSMRMYGPNLTKTKSQTGTGDPEPTSRRISDGITDFTDVPNYTRFVDYTNMRQYGVTGGIDIIQGLAGPDAFDNDINNDTSLTNLVGGVDLSFYDKIKNKVTSAGSKFANAVKDKAVIPLVPFALVVEESIKNDFGGGIVGKTLDKVFGSGNEEKVDRKDVTTVSSNFKPIDYEKIEKANKEAGFSSNLRFGFQEGGSVPSEQQAQLVGGVMPQEVSELETVADNQPRQVEENSFVLNAPSVEKVVLNPEAINVAGVQDVRKMIIDAYSFARQQGMSIGNVDRKLYEESVDVALSKGELVIPPDLVKVIGQDRLEKINNRGKKEVKRRAENLDEKTPKGLMLGTSGEGVQKKDGNIQTAGAIEDLLKSILPSHFSSAEGQSQQPVTKIDKNFNFLNAEDEKDQPEKYKTYYPEQEKKSSENFLDKDDNIDYSKQPDFDGTYSLSEIEGITFEELIFDIEGNKGVGYVPKDSPNSGITIGMGVDVGQHSKEDFDNYGVPTDITEILLPYFGVKGKKAKKLAEDNKIILTVKQAKNLNNVIISQKYKEFENFLERKHPALTKASEIDKGVLYTIYYHGSFPHKKDGKMVGYKSFIDDFTKIVKSNSYKDGDIIKSIKENVFPKIKRKGSDRNRLNKVINWYNQQPQNISVPIDKPKLP
jgi:hypothetical protein